MEERVDEGKIKGSKEIVPLDKTDLKRMSKCICKLSGEKIGTGFFCKIEYNNKLIPFLITNYHVINEDYLKDKKQLKFYINDDYQIININEKSKIYSSVREEYDVFIIKIKDDDEINNFLEIDKNIFNNLSENSYKDEPIYILHYPNSEEASVSYGNGIEKINEYDIKHLCNTESGSSGGPILSSLTNKVIGIHKGAIKKKGEIIYNIGTFLKFPLKELNSNITLNNVNNNQIFTELQEYLNNCKISPYLLDSNGNIINWENIDKKQKIGGFDFYPPIGWIGLGLNVKEKYDNGNDDWLGCNNSKNEWAVAYHAISDGRYLKPIIAGGFRTGIIQMHKEAEQTGEDCPECDDIFPPGHKVGIGVYFYPNINLLQDYFLPFTTINDKEYMIVLMVRVNPEKIRFPETEKDYWILNGNDDEVRPYRILFKRV